ncbi:MAG TPA: hypothetical protein ENH28_02540 [Euryarchaeota archaeon]|nr:hypothetical protein [Euryarchaeota archaeon]
MIIEKSGNGTLISHRETLLKNENYEEKEKEINQWLDAIKHYSELNNTFTARLSKLFMIKFL